MSKMRKGFIALLAFVLLVFSSAAYAHDNDRNKNKGNDDEREYQSCKAVIDGLQNALNKAKNEQAKKVIKKSIEELKKKCDKKKPEPQKPLNDDQRVQADKSALAINYANGDSSGRVTQSITLPTRGSNGSTITWTSGSPSFITDSGRLISQPPNSTGEVTVVMFAVIQYNNSTDFKKFAITIKPQLSDSERLAADKAALAIGFGSGDSAGSVTQPITLPTSGPNGSKIVWSSGNTSIISNDGKTVNRPAYGNGDASVSITAILQLGNAVDTKAFVVTVKQQYGDASSVAADKAALEIQYSGQDSASSVTLPIGLATQGAKGSTIIWKSSKPGIISNDGKTVNRPNRGAGDAAVVMTAIITNGAATDTKVFSLTVKQMYNDEEIVAADKAALDIIYTGHDSSSRVYWDLTLPDKGQFGSDIVWVSNRTDIISTTGKVTRPSSDTKVELTAVILYNGRADYKTFTLTVKAK